MSQDLQNNVLLFSAFFKHRIFFKDMAFLIIV